MLAVVIIIVQNHEPMSTRVSFKADFLLIDVESSEVSVYILVTISFLFGVIVTGLYGMIERFRFKKQIKVLLSSSQEKDKELNSLRNLPLTSDDVSAGPMNSVAKEAEQGNM
jgi:ATP adenylyltransferase